MNTKKSPVIKFIEKLRGGPLTLGMMLRSIRKTDEYSQIELAQKFGISKAHLCDIERGRRQVTAERAAFFAKKLGYSDKVFMELAIQDQLRSSGFKYKVELRALNAAGSGHNYASSGR